MDNTVFSLKKKKCYFHADEISSFFHGKTYAQQSTFIWIMQHCEDFQRLKDCNGKKIFAHDSSLKIDLLLGRPIIYDDNIESNTITFRAYK